MESDNKWKEERRARFREKFLALKPFDRVLDRGGRGINGHTWKVKSVVDGPRGRTVAMQRQNSSIDKDSRTVLCCWCDEQHCVIDVATYEPIRDFDFEEGCCFIPEESVDRVVEEMLAYGKLSPEDAERLRRAGENNTSEGIAIGCD